jgi:putative aldouronate transport system substrate-binding protein
MKMRKIIIILMVFSMLILFVGCQATEKAEENSDGSVSVEKDTSTSKSQEKPVLKILVVTHSWTKDVEEIPMFQELADEVGVTIEWEQVRDGWDEKKNIILASGDLPDIFISALNDSDIASFPTLFEPMNQLIEDYAPNIQTMFEELPNTKSLATSLDGNIYGLVSVIPHRPSSFNVFSINKTWLDNLGLSQPETFDDFYNVLKAFKENDPNGNGKMDEIPFDWAPDRGLFTAMSMIGAYGNYAEDFSGDWLSAKDGQVVFLPQTEDYYNLVSYLHKLYAEGLINQEIFTQDYSQFQSRSKDPEYAKVGATMGWSIEDRFGVQWKDQYVVQLPLAAEDGISPLWPANEMRTKYLTNKAHLTTSCENKEAAMKFLDGFFSEEMSAQGYYGSLDVCVEKDGDNYIVLEPENGMGADEWKWTNALVDNGLMYVSPNLESRIIAPESITQRVELDSLYREYFPEESSILPVLKFTAEENNDLALIKNDVYNIVDTHWAKWIFEGGIDSEWSSYLDSLKRAGLEDYLSIYQNHYTEYLE